MPLSIDALASLALGGACVALFVAHRLAGEPRHYRRVRQQGATFVLGLRLMDAGYWLLQPLVRVCARRGIGAGVITWCTLVPALGAALTAGLGHWGLAAWCLLASALLDVLDGAVARATDGGSADGAVLDSVLDRYAELIFFAGVFVFYRDYVGAQLVALAALAGSYLISYSTAKAEAIRVAPPRGSMKRSDRLTTLILGSALVPLSWLFALPRNGLAWPMLVALALIAVLANVSAVQRFRCVARAAQAAAVRPTAAKPSEFPRNGAKPLPPVAASRSPVAPLTTSLPKA